MFGFKLASVHYLLDPIDDGQAVVVSTDRSVVRVTGEPGREKLAANLQAWTPSTRKGHVNCSPGRIGGQSEPWFRRLTPRVALLQNDGLEPNRVAMQQGRKPPDLEIPDLVVPGTTPQPSNLTPQAYTERADVAEEPFELEPIQPAQTAGVAHGVVIDQFADDSAEDVNAVALELSVTPRAQQPTAVPTPGWPSGETPDANQVELSAAVSHASAYPEPPTNLFATPAYAWLVYRAQLRLERELGDTRTRLAQAESARDQALADWIDSIRPRLTRDDRFLRLVEPISAKEAALASGMVELERTKKDGAESDQRLHHVEAELRQRLERQSAECQALEVALGDLERALAREQAKRKRIDIDARVPSNADPDREVMSRRTAAADTAIHTAFEQLAEGRARAEAATRARDTLLFELRQLEDQRRHFAQRARQVEHRALESVASAEDSVVQLKAELGRAVLRLRDPQYLDVATLETLVRLDDAVLRYVTLAKALERASHDFDRSLVKRGIWLVLGTLMAAVFLLLAKMVW